MDARTVPSEQASLVEMMLSNIGVGCRLIRLIVGAASQLYLSLPESVFLRASDCLHFVTALHEGFRGNLHVRPPPERRGSGAWFNNLLYLDCMPHKS